jgi:hypothetical protein
MDDKYLKYMPTNWLPVMAVVMALGLWPFLLPLWLGIVVGAVGAVGVAIYWFNLFRGRPHA